jgi:isocitrate lyase
LTGNQAVQQVKAGLKAIDLSGWQVAADANTAGQMYPDQSLYPVDSVPNVLRRINNALRRADQIARLEGDGDDTYWMAPIVADAEAGFGGPLNAYELMRAMIEAGAAGVHFEDQLASEKKCGHLGGKVLVPIAQHIRTLNAARLAADVEGVATVLLCRTDAQSAQLLTSDIDERDRPFLDGGRTPEGFFRIRPGAGVDYAIARSLAYAPYADLLWWETSGPDLAEAERFADAIHREFPNKLLAYNCSSSFNWQKKLSVAQAASFQRDLARLGYRFQFVTLAGSIWRCSTWPALIGNAGWRLTPSCNRRNLPPNQPATPRRATNAKSGLAISTRWRWRSRAAVARRPRCRAAPRRHSFTRRLLKASPIMATASRQRSKGGR